MINSERAVDDYDGTSPFPRTGAGNDDLASGLQVGLTGAVVVVPFIALGLAIWLAWGHGVTLTDLLLALALYVVTGLGVTVGFHRLCASSRWWRRSAPGGRSAALCSAG
jgi:stearoyl-CoA desaturase (delta-9 desaturase)